MTASRWMGVSAAACLGLLGFGPTVQAQIDLSGVWLAWYDQDHKIRGTGPDPSTYLGVPLNADARAAALSHHYDNISMLDRQCAPYPVHYILTGPMSVTMWPTKRLDDSVLAWNIGGSVDRYPMTIWMDGRPPPGPQAAHTLGGYTTGRWMGDTLVTTTTHIQDGLLTRNGAPNSDREVLTMFITRHDNFLNITGVVHDPVYLTEPYVLSNVFSTDPAAVQPRRDSNMDATCSPQEEASSTADHRVPSYLTTSPTQMYATENFGIPQEAALGSAESMYPEYIKKLQSQYRRPQGYCTQYCCGVQSGDQQSMNNVEFNTKVLQCTQDR